MNVWERRLAIACLLVAVILLFVGASSYLVEQRLTAGASYPFIAGIALLISYVILDPTAARDLVSSRQSRFGSLSVLVTAVVIGILVMANVLAARTTQALDLTRYKVNTLAPESIKVAQQLNSDATATLWDVNNDPALPTLNNLLGRYTAVNRHLKVTVSDPNFDPATARAQGVVGGSSLPFLVISYQGKTQILTPGSQNEQDITAALLKLESSRTPVICWVGGEGEVDLKNGDSLLGYSSAADQMQKDNFAIKQLLLSQSTAVPTDCEVVAIVGPTKPLTEPAVKVLGDYLANGGRLLLALDPWREAAVTASYNSALSGHGVSFNGGLVVPEANQSARGEPTAVAIVNYGSSPIVKDLSNRVSFFPESTSIDSTTTPDVTTTVVAQTSANAYLIGTPRQPPFSQQAGDKPGSFTIMETAERAPAGGKKSRVVLVGTSAFAENNVFQASAVNIQLLTGSLNYLTEQEQLISIPPKPAGTPPLSLTQEQANLNLWITLLLLPLLVVLGGMAVWWRRRLA
ncbi:MAG: GldG family protein [Candidatus Dormibacteraeota bacterium]|nr:GldG family protein [Candidatus Dormibacteraeota bacterium]